MKKRRTKKAGYEWRVLAHRDDGGTVDVRNDGQFDELVVDGWFHIEQMSARSWWAQIGGRYKLWIHVLPGNQNATLLLEDEKTGEVLVRS